MILLRKKALLELTANKETFKIFPYQFRLNLKVEVGNQELFYLLTVFNEDKKIMPFSLGLHPYFNLSTEVFKNLKTNIKDFNPKNYKLDKTLFFKLQPVELFLSQGLKIKIDYGGDFKRDQSQLVLWSDNFNYFCVEAWSSPLGGFFKEKERINLRPGRKTEFSLKIKVFFK